MDEKWLAVFEALERVKLELAGRWPVPYWRPVVRACGYSRGRGQRPIVPDG